MSAGTGFTWVWVQVGVELPMGYPCYALVVRALEGLEFARSEWDILQDIHQGVRQLEEEPVAKAVQQMRNSSTHSLRSAEWSERDGLLYYQGCIYIPTSSELRRRIVSLCHDTKVAGHPRRFKMLELVSQNYWWPNMS